MIALWRARACAAPRLRLGSLSSDERPAALMAENAREMAELKEQAKETDRRMKETDRQPPDFEPRVLS